MAKSLGLRNSWLFSVLPLAVVVGVWSHIARTRHGLGRVEFSITTVFVVLKWHHAKVSLQIRMWDVSLRFGSRRSECVRGSDAQAEESTGAAE